MTYWPYTQQNRQIREITQDGSDINMLGWDIWYLGLWMESSAETMQNLADGSDGQQGKSVDALREKLGDAHVQLALAGELYMPLGQALKDYGSELRDTIKTAVNTAQSDAYEKWTTYTGLPGDKDGRSYFLGIGKPEEGSPEEDEHETEDAAKKQAWDDWIVAAGAYDSAYDTWETAWTNAVTTIDDAFSDDLKDSKWEKFKEGFNWVADKLSWVALGLGIAALIIGGPIIGALAALAAVTLLAMTLIQFAYGDKTLTDVAWELVGIVPVGKLGKLLQKGQKMDFVTDMVKNFDVVRVNKTTLPNGKTKFNLGWTENNPYAKGWQGVKNFETKGWGGHSKHPGDFVMRMVLGKDRDGFVEVAKDNFDMTNFRNRANPHWADWLLEVPIRAGSTGYETLHGVGSHLLKLEGWHNKIDNAVTGDDDKSWKDRYPGLKLVF